MIYPLIRPFATLAFKAYFKKIYLHHAERIPWDKPIIIAVNHPTSFLETCLMACFLPKPLNFLVRGDLFKKDIYIKLMRGLYLVPLYRQKDGYSNLTKNYETFEFCYQALAEHRNIVVLPEGSTSEEKRLRPIKKGIARICFGALEQNPDLDLIIVPVGANFTFPNRVRSEVMFEVGHPIRVQDYLPVYTENQNKAVLQLTQKVYAELEDLVLTIKLESDEKLTEGLFEIYRNEQDFKTFPIVEKSGIRLANEMAIANAVNETDPAEKEVLRKKMDDYHRLLKKNTVSDYGLIRVNQKSFFENLFLVLGAIPAFFGKWMNWLPIKYGRHVVVTKVKQKEFFASVFIAVSLIGSLIYYALIALAIGLILGKWFLPIIFLFPLLGWFSILYFDKFHLWNQKRNARKLEEPEISSLLNFRKEFSEFNTDAILKPVN